MKYVVVILGICGLAALAGWMYSSQDTEPASTGERSAVPVTVYSLVTSDFRDQTSALGTLRAWESVDISASVSQIVSSIHFEDGQQVERGDVLAVLRQGAEQASLREQQAALIDAEREVRRLENLARQNQVAQTDLDKSRTLATITRHKIEEIEARIADRTIVAPFSGVLGLRLISEGALVTAGQRLTTLDDLSRMRLDFSVPATLLAKLELGLEVTATAPAFEQRFTGTLSAIDSRIDPLSRSVLVRATMKNPDSVLKPGLLMEVLIEGEARAALLVPEESLESRTSDHFVWRVDGDVASRVKVSIGGRRPGWVEITQGLQPGDQVVRDGVGRLRGDGAAVTLVGR